MDDSSSLSETTLQERELLQACYRGDVETVERLVSRGVDVNTDFQEVLKAYWKEKLTDSDEEEEEEAVTEEASAWMMKGQWRMKAMLWLMEKAGDPGDDMIKMLRMVMDGFRPLHVAVTRGHTACVAKLLLAPGIDLKIKNKMGKTPEMLAGGHYEMLKLLRSSREFPVHTFSKVILCGNSGAGKSTFAKAIMNIYSCNEEVGSLLDRIKNVYKAAGPPKPLTAGIIPYNIQSPRGNMVLYDLAGQPEYYTSHCACIEAVSLSSPAIFLSLLDVSLSQKEITKQLYYWSTMISSVCSECPHPSEVIVVGTHADKVNQEGLRRRSNAIEDLAKTIFKKQHFRGFIALNATARFSDDMKRFIGVLSESNDTVVQQCPVISTDCNILYAFLQQMVPSEQVITISQLLSKLQADETNVLPTETSKMIPLLTILSDKGLILFIFNKHSPDESWIVLQKSVLLEKVAGVLFAPEAFGEYRALASNIGLVPIPCITECFPDLDAHMLVEFLSQLKLCHLVDSTLKIVDTSQTLLDLTRGSDNGSCYSLFFPSLINADKPDSFDADYFNTKGSFGWLMRTKDEHQFFHNRFLHVLMLTLMNGCGGTETLCNPQLKSLNRQCIVWSTGICWNSNEGATILVDVVEQFRSLHVAVSLPGPQYQELTVLQDIRKTFNQFCPSVDVEEFVIDPRQVRTLFNKGVMISSLSCVEVSTFKNAVMNKISGARDINGKSVELAEWTTADEDSCLAKVIGIENDVIGPKLEDLMNEIGAVIPSKWRDVGVQLGIAPGVLDGIQRQNAEKPRSCQVSFEQVFNEWKLQGSETPYTWTHIIGILRRPAIGENDLAETLATKFK